LWNGEWSVQELQDGCEEVSGNRADNESRVSCDDSAKGGDLGGRSGDGFRGVDDQVSSFDFGNELSTDRSA
jgi:hypothetical protein